MKAILAAMALCTSLSYGGAPVRFASGPAQVQLVELYTSEGCSSCPPADQWLGALKSDAGLWKTIVPIEFHVNYWDSLGWTDRLSSRQFTAREYAYAAAWGSPNVYTPCFVRNGAEWKPSWGVPGARGGPAGELEVEADASGSCSVIFVPAAPASPGAAYRIHLALLGGGISSRVTAGENSGSTLRHEFVVLGLAEKDLATAGPSMEARLRLPEPSVADASRRSLAAWVTAGDRLAPLQATGGWLP
jgi:hypothetical protein